MVNCTMTELNKPIRRRTRDAYSILYVSSRHARKIVVELKPGDIIEFREAGRRIRWQLPIETAFRYALNRAANARLKP